MAAGDKGHLADPQTTPLSELDVSDPRRFELDCWQPLFERLRRESPIHFQAESPAGAFWSITRFEDDTTALAKSYEDRRLPTMALEIARRMTASYSVPEAMAYYKSLAMRTGKSLARWRVAATARSRQYA